MAEFAIRCSDLVKRYEDVVAVNGLDLEVARGECFGLLGPNGAGKTTTVEILEGLLEPDEGSVEILGQSWNRNERQLRERLGIQLQETRLSEKLTVTETIRMFRSFYRRGLDVGEVLSLVGLEEKAGAWVRKLSGGQHQRLSLACALVSEPEVLFLDEPTTGLDPRSRRQVWEVVRGFRNRRRTVLLTTHYMDDAERLCDRVAIIDHGVVIAMGTPRDLINSLGAEHVVDLDVDGDADLASLRNCADVRAISADGGSLRATVGQVHHAVPALLEELRRQGLELTRFTTHHATLEDVFVALTGRHLQDERSDPE